MPDFTWQQWSVAVFIFFSFMVKAFSSRIPDDYFHPGYRAARLAIFLFFVMALITGGFWK